MFLPRMNVFFPIFLTVLSKNQKLNKKNRGRIVMNIEQILLSFLNNWIFWGVVAIGVIAFVCALWRMFFE